MRLLLPLLVLIVFVGTAAGPPPPPVEAAVVPTGRAPCGLAAHGGELWVGVYEAGTVLRLDRAGRVQRRIRSGPWPCRIAVDGRAVWVTRDRSNAVVRIDRRSGRQRTIGVSSPFDVVLAGGAVWVTSFEAGTVTRIDPESRRSTRALRIGGHPAGVTSCGETVWVGHGRDATWLTAIDPKTGSTRQVDVGVPSPGWPRCVLGELWVTTRDSVLRVAPRSGAVRAGIAIGGTPAEATAVQGAIDGHWMIWVTDKERSLVHRVSRETNRVVNSFPAGPGAYALARFGGSIWITSFAGADVRRFDP